MPKFATRKKNADSKESTKTKKVSTKGLSREDVYKKPPLAQLYDKLNPGDYTIRQDFYHSLFIFAFIAIIIICISVMGISTHIKESNMRSSHVTIPATAFVSGQESNITDQLSGSGFVDVGFDENGNIIAYGTPNMTQQYKDSFYEKHIKPLSSILTGDLTQYGIESIEVSDDGKTMTIRTYRDLTVTSVELGSTVESKDISKLISEYSTWCGVRNNGEPMKVNFVNIMDLTDGTNGTQYWSSTRPTGAQMVADLEEEEKKALNEATSKQTGEGSEQENDDEATGNSSQD